MKMINVRRILLSGIFIKRKGRNHNTIFSSIFHTLWNDGKRLSYLVARNEKWTGLTLLLMPILYRCLLLTVKQETKIRPPGYQFLRPRVNAKQEAAKNTPQKRLHHHPREDTYNHWSTSFTNQSHEENSYFEFPKFYGSTEEFGHRDPPTFSFIEWGGISHRCTQLFQECRTYIFQLTPISGP